MLQISFPVRIYLLKVNHGNTETMCEIYSEFTTKTPEQRNWRCSGVFIVKFEQTSHIVLVFPFLTSNKWMPAGLLVSIWYIGLKWSYVRNVFKVYHQIRHNNVIEVFSVSISIKLNKLFKVKFNLHPTPRFNCYSTYCVFSFSISQHSFFYLQKSTWLLRYFHDNGVKKKTLTRT